jgi:hypothetical protein
MGYFVESNDESFANQLDQFATELPNYKDELGFTDAEADEAKDDAAFMKWVVKTDGINEDYAHSFKSFKNQARNGKTNTALAAPPAPIVDAMPKIVNDGIQARFVQKANKAKNAIGVTEDILKALGLVSTGTGAKGDPSTDTPDLKVVLNAGYPELSFHLKGYKSVNIYKDAGSGYGNKPYKTLLSSPFKDKELPALGQTALYKYKAIYVVNDEETGTMSAEVSVAVVGR